MSSTTSKNKKNKKNKLKVILAYSGGLDTSVIAKWLEERGYDVICYIADVGQNENFADLKNKALQSGACKVVVEDLKTEFTTTAVFPAMQFHALYEGRYYLGTSLARPIIAKGLVQLAKKEKTNLIAHGATGKGNDQVRFELAAYALMPNVQIIAPWRMKEFNQTIKGRSEAIAYAASHRIPVKATTNKPWSSDDNLLHISFEAGVLEDIQTRPPKEMFTYTRSPQDAPDKPEALHLTFKAGVPTHLNGKPTEPVPLMQSLGRIAGKHGIGRVDIVESRFVGMKSRGVYETPAGTLLYAAHRDLEGFTLDREVIALKDQLMPKFAQWVYNGFWFSHEMNCLLVFLKETQKNISGTVHLELYKGNITIIKRESENSLYDVDIASMEADSGQYNPQDAEGFIKLNALRLKKWHLQGELNPRCQDENLVS